jgi:pimeloyl-ACP methyl ester carboxylesterase
MLEVAHELITCIKARDVGADRRSLCLTLLRGIPRVSTMKKPELVRQSCSCTSSRPITRAGNRRCVTSRAVTIVGDENDACIEPSLFLKQTIPASGLAMFPKTGHILNLEEPALFNETLERFLGLAEAGRWPPRDPASRRV